MCAVRENKVVYANLHVVGPSERHWLGVQILPPPTGSETHCTCTGVQNFEAAQLLVLRDIPCVVPRWGHLNTEQHSIQI